MNEQNLMARVTIVDDDQELLEDLQILLKGFLVAFVRSQGEALVEQTKQLTRLFRPHIVILDVCLLNDLNPSDQSGLRLLPSVDSAYCILYSGYLTHSMTSKLHTLSNLTWIRKGRLEELMEKLRYGAAMMCASVKRLTIHWPLDFSSQRVMRSIFGSNVDMPTDMPDDLLCQLFPYDTKLTLEPIGGEAISSYEVSRGRSVVLKVHWIDRVPVVVKFSPAERLRQEEDNYREFVENKLEGHFNAQLKKAGRFWDLGGAVYSFIGAPEVSLPTFATFYLEQSDPEVILRPLRHFFETVWQLHYNNKMAVDKETLFDLYDHALRLRERLPKVGEFVAGPYSHLFLDFTNPLTWLAEHVDESRLCGMYTAVTHGDLHGDNLFVDGRYAWAIDFERTGQGHILRDFVELEIDIIVRLLPIDSKLFREFALVLVGANSPTEALHVSDQLKAESKAYKALQVIQGIRQTAHTVTQGYDPREYLWGLLLDALFVTTLPLGEQQQYERAFILASTICDRLQQGDGRGYQESET